MKLLLWFSAVLLDVLSVKGLNPTWQRILGGSLVAPNSITYIVSLQTSRGQHFCGGSLIHKSWVLTAAHCNMGLNDMLIVAGENSLINTDGTELYIKPRSLVPHPQYNNRTYDNDIMLIKLSVPVFLSPAVSLVALPRPDAPVGQGRLCQVSGWGFTSLEQEQAPLLSSLWTVIVPIVSSTQCNSSESFNGTITQNMICAGSSSGGKDACKGDSGGPLVCGGRVYGLVSWGKSCGEASFPGVYTAVSRYRRWIEQTIFSSYLRCSGSTGK